MTVRTKKPVICGEAPKKVLNNSLEVTRRRLRQSYVAAKEAKIAKAITIVEPAVSAPKKRTIKKIPRAILPRKRGPFQDKKRWTRKFNCDVNELEHLQMQ
ncbi:unnamed protein product [Aphanomyces euteiches]